MKHDWGASRAADRVIERISGLAPSRWERRGQMNLQAYVDESSGDDIFVLAGCLATPMIWADFSREWEQRLRFATLGARNKYRFKMSEMASTQDRLDAVPIFYRVIESYVQFAFSLAFRISDLHCALDRITLYGRPLNWGYWRNPYFFGVRGLVDRINFERNLIPTEAIGRYDCIDFIFDEKQFEKKIIISGWDEIKKFMPSEVAVLYGNTPRFEDEEDYLPLQAADFWAWWIHHSAVESSDPSVFRGFPWKMLAPRPIMGRYWFTEQTIIDFVLGKYDPRITQNFEIREKKTNSTVSR